MATFRYCISPAPLNAALRVLIFEFLGGLGGSILILVFLGGEGF
jgi:hypothetical protein